jgi:NitT/TauT family transport system permease protein
VVAELSLVRRRPEVVLSPLVLAAVVVVWQVAVDRGLISRFALPLPADVGRALQGIVSAPWFGEDLLVTVTELVLAFGLAATIGIAIAILLTSLPSLRRVSYPYVVLFQVIPSVALAPILISLLGFGMGSKVALGFAIALFPVIVNTMAGIDRVPVNAQRLMTSLLASRVQRLRMLVLPASLPHIFAGLRIAVTLALVGVLVGEFVLATSGLGVRLVEYGYGLKLPHVWSLVIVIALLGIASYLLVVLVERAIVRWR